jgi:hypothetical protein
MPIKVSQKNQCLVVPPAPGVLTMFSRPLTLPDGNKVIPHGMRETLMLRHLGFNVPNPMGLYYDWRGGKPYAVQRKTAEMLVENPRAYVLNHMGTGKTKVLCGRGTIFVEMVSPKNCWWLLHCPHSTLFGPGKCSIRSLDAAFRYYMAQNKTGWTAWRKTQTFTSSIMTDLKLFRASFPAGLTLTLWYWTSLQYIGTTLIVLKLCASSPTASP